MKKFLPYILIVIIFAQLFVPLTIGSGVKNNIAVVPNKAEAADGIRVTTVGVPTNDKITATVRVVWGNTGWRESGAKTILYLMYPGTKEVLYGVTLDLKTVDADTSNPNESNADQIQQGVIEFPNLKSDTDYQLFAVSSQNLLSWGQTLMGIGGGLLGGAVGSLITPVGGTVAGIAIGVKLFTPNADTSTTTGTPIIVHTNVAGVTTPGTAVTQISVNDAAILPICALNNLGGCVGVILYRFIFQPSAYIFAITGKLLDYTLFYTIQDTSYRSVFVTQGWGIVRDFVNMFFIFVLLYIAFKTILGLGASKTKEMVINVVIIGLLINFSLFATQVIIDASNILTRVFYNQIQSGNKVDGKFVEELSVGGSKGVTAALVNKINPQQIIFSAGEAAQIQPKGTTNNGSDNNGNPSGVDNTTFILVTILASIMNLVGLWVFFMVSMVFIIRVVGLWIAMILAPLAFFSYTMPELQDMEMIGWKHWWPETLKMAFLAPVFIFFLYIIIQFLSSGLGVVAAAGKHGLDFFIAIIVPFAFLMILLSKAKDITTKMAGKMGEMVSKAAGTIGGAAVGLGMAAATGGASMAMRGTLGAFGSKIGNSEKLAAIEAKGGAKGWMAGKLRDVGTSTGKASFDVRNTKLGAGVAKSAGITGLGKGKEGGFDKYKEEKDKTRKERAEKIKTITTKGEQKNVTAAQIDLKETMLAKKPALDSIDKEMAKVRQEMDDAAKGKDKVAARAALAKLEILKKERDNIRNTKKEVSVNSAGARTIGPNDAKDSNGNIMKSIQEAENAERDALHNVAVVENKILNEFAQSLTTNTSRTINLITSLGQDRRSGVEKTAMDIRAGKKVEKDKGDVGK